MFFSFFPVNFRFDDQLTIEYRTIDETWLFKLWSTRNLVNYFWFLLKMVSFFCLNVYMNYLKYFVYLHGLKSVDN